MPSDAPVIRCKILFRSTEDGGRQHPLRIGALKSRQYMPHFVLGQRDQAKPIVGPGNELTETYLGVQFVDGPNEFTIGEEIEAQALLLYWDHAPKGFYDGLTPGTTFTIREGGRIVGDGVVMGP